VLSHVIHVAANDEEMGASRLSGRVSWRGDD
jgi:hypothetical protein